MLNPQITIIGLTLRSPCLSCLLHQCGAEKNKNKHCLTCQARVHYDLITAGGWSVVPFLSKKIMNEMENMRIENLEINNI